MEKFYKVYDLFGNEEKVIINKTNKNKKNLFTDYDAFLEKFDVKKTTDDCYTPKEVMELVINYVNEKYNLEGKKIIRPFFPGGDYESVEYTEDMVVIDNPPFSIITQICKYYIKNNVKFFLFAPHLTNFGSDIDCTHIIASANIKYENGATIKTSFLSNLFGDIKVLGDSKLCQNFKDIEEKNKVNLPKYKYPDNIVTVSSVAYCVEKGVDVVFHKKELKHYRGMDAQKKHGKALFGSGFLGSNKVAQAQAQAQAQKKENVFIWQLSEKEKNIIKSLED